MSSTAEPKPRRLRLRKPKGWKKGRVRRSKMIRDRAKDADTLLASIDKHKERVVGRLDKRLRPLLRDGEAMPNYALALDLAGRRVAEKLEGLLTAEDRYLRDGTRCTTLRRECERVSRHEIYPQVVSVRRSIDSLFGRELGESLHGMEGKTRRKARRLETQLHFLVRMLRKQDKELPEPLLAGSTVDRAAWLRQVEPGYQKLVAMLRELVLRELDQEYACDQKTEAMKAYDVAYREALRYLEGIYTLADVDRRRFKNLRSYIQRRRLGRKARGEGAARAAGRRRASEKVAGAKVTRLANWIGRLRS